MERNKSEARDMNITQMKEKKKKKRQNLTSTNNNIQCSLKPKRKKQPYIQTTSNTISFIIISLQHLLWFLSFAPSMAVYLLLQLF